MTGLIGCLAIMAASLAGVVALSPEAKEWLESIIRRCGEFSCSELLARAAAQRAARVAWTRVYERERIASREAGR